MFLLPFATLGGAIIGFLTASCLFLRGMTRDDINGMGGLFLPVYILYMGIIGAVVGTLIGFTTSLAGIVWGVPGICGGIMVWGIGFAVWYSVRWFSDPTHY